MNHENLNTILIWGIIVLAGSLIFSIAIAQTVAVILVLVWIIKLVKTRNYNLKGNPFLFPFLTFIMTRILSIFFSIDFSASLQILNREIFFYLLFFIIVDVFPINDKKYIKTFFYVLIMAAVVASIYGIAKVILGYEIRASSTTSGYSTLGMFLAVIVSIVLALGKNKYFFPSKITWGLVIAIIIAGILFTFNRTHWAIVGLVFLLVGFIRERKLLLIMAIFAAILIFIIPSLQERFYQLIFFKQNFSDRDVIWQGAFMVWNEHPIFGFGPKTFNEIFPLFNKLADKGISSWHCDYLQVYIESGIAGLIPFLWLLVSIYYFGIKILRDKNFDDFFNDLTLAVILGMAAFYLTAIIGGFIFDPISSLVFQMLLGILALLIKINKNNSII